MRSRTSSGRHRAASRALSPSRRMMSNTIRACWPVLAASTTWLPSSCSPSKWYSAAAATSVDFADFRPTQKNTTVVSRSPRGPVPESVAMREHEDLPGLELDRRAGPLALDMRQPFDERTDLGDLVGREAVRTVRIGLCARTEPLEPLTGQDRPLAGDDPSGQRRRRRSSRRSPRSRAWNSLPVSGISFRFEDSSSRSGAGMVAACRAAAFSLRARTDGRPSPLNKRV